MPPENASAVLLGALSKLLTETAAAPLRLEVDGVDEVLARQAFRLAAAKLPIQTTFVIRQVGA